MSRVLVQMNLPPVWQKNIDMLWQVIEGFIATNNIQKKSKEYTNIVQVFRTIIGRYYEMRYHTHKYKSINREILTEIHKYIQQIMLRNQNQTQSQSPHQFQQQQPPIQTKHENIPITHAEISQLKQQEFSTNFTKIQNEFNQYNQKPQPKHVKFEEDIDEPNVNIDELLKKELESRKYDSPGQPVVQQAQQHQSTPLIQIQDSSHISQEFNHDEQQTRLTEHGSDFSQNNVPNDLFIHSVDDVERLRKKVIEHGQRIQSLEYIIQIMAEKQNIPEFIQKHKTENILSPVQEEIE